jgi:adenylylsulfate kinase
MDVQAHGTGFVVWLTGMNRAGKSSIAAQLTARLQAVGKPAELLDEDGSAKLLLDGLGASKDERAVAVARLGFVAQAVMRAGGIAVCAALSPYRDARDQLRREARRFVEVFVDCGMEELQRRDPSGLYRKALAGEVTNVPGVDVPYEPPLHPELVVHTDQTGLPDTVLRVLQALVDGRFIAPADFTLISGGQRPRRARPAAAGRGGALRKRTAKAAAARKAPSRKAPPRKSVFRGAEASQRRR